jgi:hypothetical protein
LQWERDLPESEEVDPTDAIIVKVGEKSRTFSDIFMTVYRKVRYTIH